MAESEEAALEAVKRVELDLEELPAVFDVEEALKPDAPRVTHWDTNHFWYEGHHCRRVRYGDAAAARAGADHVIEGTYQNSPTEHAPTETTGCIAKPEADGRITVHTNTQALYFSLDNTAIILQIEPAPAALHGRHGRRRVRRQGRRHHRADRLPGGAQDGQAGPLRLLARGGDARVARRAPATGSGSSTA